jgi:lysophospholipase L1-like esterase
MPLLSGLKTTLTITGITLGLLLALEFGLRLVFPEKTHLDSGNATLEGYRGGPLQKAPEIRVEVFGDSNIEAVFSSQENTFAGRLEKELAERWGKRVEVINAGVVGYGPDQSLLRLRHDAETLHPSIVIFHVFADNDFGDLIRNRIFRVGEKGLERRSDPFQYPRAGRMARLQDFAASLLLVKAGLKLARLGAVPAAATPAESTKEEDYLAKLERVSEHEYQAYLSGAPDTSQLDHYDLDVAAMPDQPSAELKVGLMRAVLAEAQALAKERGIQLLVLIEPSGVDLTTSFRISYRDLQRYPMYRRERLSETVRTICDQLGIPYVDLFPVFERSDPERLYFRETDNHWNDAGQALAAREVAGSLADLSPEAVQTAR